MMVETLASMSFSSDAVGSAIRCPFRSPHVKAKGTAPNGKAREATTLPPSPASLVDDTTCPSFERATSGSCKEANAATVARRLASRMDPSSHRTNT
eukprot:scaffold442661_cov29-Prasinocladus_malaysianus.AAC.1